MNRFLKQHFRRFLPEGLRGRLKRRLQQRFADPVDRIVVVEETDGALRCTVDNRWSFLAPPACRQELLHYTTTSEGRGELYGIANLASRGGLLFDVGAHSGFISALFCAAHPQNQVVSFEPSPVLSERLSTIRALNSLEERMRIEKVAIGDRSGTMSMLLDPAGGFIQVQRFEHSMLATPQSVDVRMETLADAATRLVAVPQFVKLDIESYEFEAIHGSIEFLSRYKPAIFLELHLNYLEERHLSPRAVVETLERCGYQFYTWDGSRLSPKEIHDCPLSTIHLVAR
jgi:FkbM family methyltransferase